MAYARLQTRNTSGLHPNLRGSAGTHMTLVRGLGNYAANITYDSAGLRPGFRGLGDVPLTSFTIGPGGQFAITSATTPTSTSIWDSMLTWMGSSTLIPGMPNSIFAIAAGLFVAVKVFGGKR